MNILLGVTGSISAYKAADIIGGLYAAGGSSVKVKAVMTEAAKKFISQLTLATISKNPVYDEDSEWEATGKVVHIELARWLDVLVVAPATKNTIVKMATGITDNLLTSVYAALSVDKEVVICPAMNTLMWENLKSEGHLDTVHNKFSTSIVGPISGPLACGDVGMGKIAPTRDIVKRILKP